MTLTARGNSNVELMKTGLSSSRRAPSPVVARGRVVDNQPKGRVNGNRDNLKPVENQKVMVPERKPAKPASGGEIGGYGLTMSKNSLNMALKHMDIRQGTGGVRGASLFPHSIRSATTAASKDRPASKSDPMAAVQKSGVTVYSGYANELMSKDCHESSSESCELGAQ
ncbi:hypothetical protein KSP40_PGU017425 [Platanthera guangdongensis]|uniref:Uncharacterized protein n=1 Tax=Platanthera guangdongensis TaxID=2320717 RepID=A0ABR2LXK7_9ASPA